MKEPKVILAPEAQARVDADPEMAKAIQKFSADARQVMLGMQTGQYKSFEAGMASLGYEGEEIDPDNPPDDMPKEALEAMEDFIENGPPDDKD